MDIQADDIQGRLRFFSQRGNCCSDVCFRNMSCEIKHLMAVNYLKFNIQGNCTTSFPNEIPTRKNCITLN